MMEVPRLPSRTTDPSKADNERNNRERNCHFRFQNENGFYSNDITNSSCAMDPSVEFLD
jgi:hypothetical protein